MDELLSKIEAPSAELRSDGDVEAARALGGSTKAINWEKLLPIILALVELLKK